MPAKIAAYSASERCSNWLIRSGSACLRSPINAIDAATPLTAQRRPSLIVWVGVLLGRLADGFEKPRIFDLWLLGVLTDGFNPELPVVTKVEQECHFGAGGREGLDDPGPLHAAGLALSQVREQFVLHGRAEDVSARLAVKAKGVVEIKAEDLNDRGSQVVEIFGPQDLEFPVNLGI